MDRRAWTGLLALSALWGSSYLFIKVALDDVSPAMVVFARTAVAAVVLVPFAMRRGALTGVREQLLPIAFLASFQITAPFLLISAGERDISSSLTGILVATAPIWAFVIAVRIDPSERVRGIGAAGVATGIAGVVLLLGVDAGGGTAALAGGLMVVLASLGYALGAFYVKRRLTELDPIGVVAAAMGVAALLSVPFVAAAPPTSGAGLDTFASLAALGVLGTGVAFVLFYTLIGSIGPGRASLVAYLAPAFAVFYGVVVLGEGFGVSTAVGLALIVGGSYVAAEGRLPWRRRSLTAAGGAT